MGDDPKWLRESGRLLSRLLQTQPDGLADYVRERLDDREVDLEQLAAARKILLLISRALRDKDPARLQGVAYACRNLQDWEEGISSSDEEESAAASEPAEPIAPKPIEPIVVPAPRPPVAAPAAPGPGGPSPWARGQGPPAMPAPVSPASAAPAPAAPAPVAPAPAAPAPVAPAPAAPAPAAPAPALASSSPAPASAPPVPSAPAGSTPLTGTAGPSQQGVALPFQSDPAAARPAKISLEPHAELGQTAPVKPNPNKQSTLPFRATLTLGDYAKLCAERAMWPDHRAQLLAKFGVPPEHERLVDDHFRAMFKRSPDQEVVFNQLLDVARRQLGG